MRHFVVPLALALTATAVPLAGCVSSKEATPEVVHTPCVTAVEQWAGDASVNEMPQEDGGIIFTKPGPDHMELFVIVSPKFIAQVRKSVVNGQQVKTIGLAKESTCRHPQNDFVYHTLAFRVTPPKQYSELKAKYDSLLTVLRAAEAYSFLQGAAGLGRLQHMTFVLKEYEVEE